MRVEQAVYGEVQGRGHGLRASSPNAQIAAVIASRLDLPDAVPPGVQGWSPFVRGFPVDDHYVLARTFLDLNASRGGMVLTHAIIVSLDDMCKVGSLAALFGCLATTVSACPTAVGTLDVDVSGGSFTPPPDLIGTANALAGQGPAPVVRLGVDGFEQLVDSLWQALWPSLRRNFGFRLSFGPNDVVEQVSPALVCTPEQVQARWTKHRIVKPDDQAPESASAAVLCGQREAAPLLVLAGELGFEVTTLRELNRLERLHTLISGDDGFEELLAAIRLVDGLSNRPTLGAGQKDKLIQRLTSLMPSAGCKQLLLMRNLALAGFTTAESLWSAIELLVGSLGFAAADDNDLMEIVDASTDENLALAPWRTAITAGVLAAAGRDDPAILRAIWRWAERSQGTFVVAVRILPTEDAVEQRLAREAPRKLHVENAAALLLPLLKKRWLTAYGAVLAATLPPLDAVEQQLKVDKDPDQSAGLRSALRYASSAQTLECALALNDPRLIDICADVATARPLILVDLRCDDVTEQRIWSAAIGKDSSLWNAPRNPIGVRDTVLGQLAEGRAIDTGLLAALAKTPLADLTATPVRELIWLLLPTSQRDRFLEATATGWLDAATNDAWVSPPEAALDRAIMASPSLQSTLERSSVTVSARLAIVGALPSFREEVFITWLDSLLRGTSLLSQADSEQLGTLVAVRHWERAAKHLSERLIDHRPDLMPSLRQCASLLAFYTRWKIGITKPSADEKWCAFEEEARDLYASGPDANELWSRAGGKNSDLPGWSESGGTRWYTALNAVRYGGRPTAGELLAMMCVDFPWNEKLRLYASDTDIVGWR